jgi:integrase/recombinase XerD
MTSLTHANPDQKLIDMWLHGRPTTTQKEYCRDVQYFLDLVGKPLTAMALEDLQSFATHLSTLNLKERTIRRKINSVKSLFSFAAKLNYVRFNVAAALRLPKIEYAIAHRILPQREILKLINAATPGRDRALLKLLYATGMRISEACGLNWEDFIERDDGTIQVSILGKGGKRRVVLVPDSVWVEVEALRGGDADESPVFVSVRGRRRLDRSSVHRIIKEAALKAGVNPKISAHWMRHANASHALQRGASLPLVKESLGHSSIAVTDIYLHASPKDSTSNYLGF